MNTFKIKISTCLFSLFFFISCKNTNTLIEKNNKLTVETVNKLRDKNNNAFYINSTHANFSYVWTYDNNKILIYEFLKGKVIKERVYPTENNDWIKTISREDIKELDPCLELDGDGIGITLIVNENKIDEKIPVNLKCLHALKCKSEFLNRLIWDMNNYEIKWW